MQLAVSTQNFNLPRNSQVLLKILPKVKTDIFTWNFNLKLSQSVLSTQNFILKYKLTILIEV